MATRKKSARSAGTTGTRTATAARKTTVARKSTSARKEATGTAGKVARTAASGNARKTAARGTAAKKATATKVPSKKTVSKKTTSNKVASKKTATKKAPVRKTASTITGAARKPSTPSAARTPSAASSRRRKVTPEQALANTRQLLEAKQAKRHETPPWQALGEGGGHGSAQHAGFQSDDARVHAYDLHKDEMDLPAVQGHVNDLNRQKQGRRDNRTQNRR